MYYSTFARAFCRVRVFTLLLSAGGVFATLPVQAELRTYAASPDNSMWKLAKSTRLMCVLSHNIPHYGNATFTSYAHREQNLEFELDMLRMPDNYDIAEVKSVPPSWRPGLPERRITEMDLLKQFDSSVSKKSAWTLINELEKGYYPTFYYADFYSPYDKIAVGLSSVNFRQSFDQFLQCNDQLLPYSFEDITLTVLTYDSNTTQLTKDSQKRLAMIGEYLKHDPNIEQISIDAYSDSYGGRALNLELSKQRAEKIREYLMSMGVDEKRCIVRGFGEKRHIASNQTELGRATNRRVVIQMTKSAI